MEKTLIIIKPDAVEAKCVGKIIDIFETHKFDIIQTEMMDYFLKGLSKMGITDLNFCRERLELDVKINTQGLIYWQQKN